jgi:nucleoside 2-deoxyribosyltransferase
MRAFLSIKFWGDDRNKEHVERVINAIEGTGLDVFCFRRDAEEWGKIRFKPDDMMKVTFTEIESSQVLIADVADWPIGVGVEAGYAFAKGIPVICICEDGKSMANTVAGLANGIIKYKSYDDLRARLVLLVRKLQ